MRWGEERLPLFSIGHCMMIILVSWEQSMARHKSIDVFLDFTGFLLSLSIYVTKINSTPPFTITLVLVFFHQTPTGSTFNDSILPYTTLQFNHVSHLEWYRRPTNWPYKHTYISHFHSLNLLEYRDWKLENPLEWVVHLFPNWSLFTVTGDAFSLSKFLCC